MRFAGHQTFHLRESWLSKGILQLNENPQLFSEEEAPEKLGVGKNMVDSMSYWLRACQLIEKDQNQYVLTNAGRLVCKNDPFFELDGTLHVIHYLLATNIELATTWYWFFNKFSVTEFDFESLELYLKTYVDNNHTRKVNATSLSKDVHCLVRMYSKPNYSVRSNPETENPSPFVKFDILKAIGQKFVKSSFKTSEIDSLVFVYLLSRFCDEKLGDTKAIDFHEIATGDSSPSVVFGLAEDQTIEIIERIVKDTGDKYLQYSRTGGYFVVTLNRENCSKALTQYYKQNKKYLG